MNSIWGDFARMIYHVEVQVEGQEAAPPVPPRRVSPGSSASTAGRNVTYSGGGARQGAMAIAAAAGEAAAMGAAGNGEAELPPAVEQRRVDETEQIGRNDPGWCGSGKKYKKCHG